MTMLKKNGMAGLLMATLSCLQAEPVEGLVEYDLQPLVVSGTAVPKRSMELIKPASVRSGDALRNLGAATVGGLVEGLPGVHEATFGAGVSRPVIRGFDGPRIRLLESGYDAFDVSASSPDHAVTIEPFFVDRVEVLRGAGTLMYGSSAIGGAVNVLDRRIAREVVVGPELAMQTIWSSVDSGEGGGFLAAHGEENWAVRMGGYLRRADDYELPGDAESKVLEDTFSESASGSVSLAYWPAEGTRLTVSALWLDSEYGVPGHAHHDDEHEEEHADHEEHEEEDHHDEEAPVWIELEQRSFGFELEHLLAGGPLKSVEVGLRYADYMHQEWEGDHRATRFGKTGLEGRIEGLYSDGGDVSGVLGVHAVRAELTTEGEESNTPNSDVEESAVFVLQEWLRSSGRYEVGLRFEEGRIDPKSDASAYRDRALSASIGGNWEVAEGARFAVALSRAARHPTSIELYSNGAHAATRTFEVGDSSMGIETSMGLDVSLRLEKLRYSAELTAFWNGFEDYIHADFTGEERGGFDVIHYRADDAEFSGFETEIVWHVWHGESSLHIMGMSDFVRAELSGSGENLPRIPPLRIGFGVLYELGSQAFEFNMIRAFEQSRTALRETGTPAYTDVDLSYTRRFEIGSLRGRVRVTMSNLLDEVIRYHTSPLKDEAPQPGRGVRALVELAF